MRHAHTMSHKHLQLRYSPNGLKRFRPEHCVGFCKDCLIIMTCKHKTLCVSNIMNIRDTFNKSKEYSGEDKKLFTMRLLPYIKHANQCPVCKHDRVVKIDYRKRWLPDDKYMCKQCHTTFLNDLGMNTFIYHLNKNRLALRHAEADEFYILEEFSIREMFEMVMFNLGRQDEL